MTERASNADTSSDPRMGELPRCLSLVDGVSILVGSVIGIGIFLTPNIVAADTGSASGVLLAWILGGFLSLCGALTFAELGAALPRPGAQFVFLKAAYGPLLAFIYGWADLTVMSAGSYAGFGVAFRDILGGLMAMPSWMLQLTPVILILIMLAINMRATKLAATVQDGFAFLKIAAVALLIGAVFAPGVAHWKNIFAVSAARSNGGYLTHLLMGTVPVLFTFNGWHRLSYSAGEMVQPERNFIRATFVGMLVLIIIFLGTNVSGLMVMSVHGMAVANNFGSELVKRALGSVGGNILSIAILLSIAGVICTNMLTIPRIFFTMAREKLFYAPVGGIHATFKTPTIAILIPTTIGIIMSQLASFQTLVTYIVVFNQVFFALTAIAVIILRRKRPDLARPYKVWGYPFVPLIFVSGILLVVSNEFLRPSKATALAIFGVIIVLLGVPIYYLFCSPRRPTNKEIPHLEESQ